MKRYFSIYLFLFGILFISETAAQDGLVRNYYPNRRMESAIYYIRDILHGTARWFYENGVLKEEKNYSMGVLNGWLKTYYENSAPKEEIYIKEGKKDGIAKYFYDNGGLREVKIYAEGKLQSTRQYKFDASLKPPTIENKTNDALMKPAPKGELPLAGKTGDKNAPPTFNNESIIKEKPDNEPRISAVENPNPIGGMEAVIEKVKYPSLAKSNHIQGDVVIRAYIDEAGSVTKTEIVKGVGFGCDYAAEDAVRATKFHPGKQNGQPVKTTILIPVKFRL